MNDPLNNLRPRLHAFLARRPELAKKFTHEIKSFRKNRDEIKKELLEKEIELYQRYVNYCVNNPIQRGRVKTNPPTFQ